MEGVTLLESGTTRAHFALVKQLEQAPSVAAAHGLALHTLTLLRQTLSSTSFASPSSLCSHLIVLLHILRTLPSLESKASVESWALVPSLHLAATGETSKQVTIAYQLLGVLLLTHVTAPATAVAEEDSTSLLQLNTLRSHLTAKPDTPLARIRLHCALVHTDEAVRAGKIGNESLPALWTPLLSLTRSIDVGTREKAVLALGLLSRVGDEAIKAVARSRMEEILGAAAEAEVSSTQEGETSSSGRSKGKKREKSSHSKSEHGSRRRKGKEVAAAVPHHIGPETQASVKLVALRGLKLALQANETQPSAAATSALEILRGSSSASASHTTLLLGALELLTLCAGSKELSSSLTSEIRSATLALLVHVAPQQTGSAYALQLSSTALLGALSTSSSTESSKVDAEGWTALNITLKVHLAAKNGNRKAVAVRMLHALLPLGWAQGSGEEALVADADMRAEAGEEEGTERSKGRVVVEESEFGALMSCLAHPDETIRALTLRLLYDVETSIVQQHQAALLRALGGEDVLEMQDVARRAMQCAWVSASCGLQRSGDAEALAEEYANVVCEVTKSLGKSKGDSVQNWLLELVLGDVRGGVPNFGALVTEAFLKRLSEMETNRAGSTECLLVSALLIEWALALRKGEVLRERVVDVLLKQAVGKASIAEALLLALVRLSAVQPLPTSEHALRVEKLLDESNEVQLSKGAAARAMQYVHLARDTEAAKAVNDAAGAAPTMLDMIEALDSYFSTSLNTGSKSNAPRTTALSSPKPLRFEPYAAPSSSSRDVEAQSQLRGAWNRQGTGNGNGKGAVANVVEALGASVGRLNFSLGLRDEWGEGGRYATVPSSAVPLLEQEQEEEEELPMPATATRERGRNSTSSNRPDLILFDAEACLVGLIHRHSSQKALLLSSATLVMPLTSAHLDRLPSIEAPEPEHKTGFERFAGQAQLIITSSSPAADEIIARACKACVTLAAVARLQCTLANCEATELQLDDAFVDVGNTIHASLHSRRKTKDDAFAQPFVSSGNHVERSDSDSEYTTDYKEPQKCKPDIVVVDPSCLGRVTTDAPALSDLCSFGEVTLSADDDSVQTLLAQNGRLPLAFALAHPCAAQFHGWTLTGHLLRLYRFTPDAYYCSKPIDVTDPKQLPDLVRFVAFITDPASCLLKLEPKKRFAVQLHGSEMQEQWEWGAAPKLLSVKQQLFGSRTCCWGGQARRVSADEESEKQDIKYESLVLKTCWLPSSLLHHEADILQVLESRQVEHIPKVLGTLVIDADFAEALASSADELHCVSVELKLQSRNSSESPKRKLKLQALVLRCAIGEPMGRQTTMLEAVAACGSVVSILKQMASAGVHFRDLNLGNVLRCSSSSAGASASPSMLVDFGNARFHGRAKGQTSDTPLDELARDDYRSATQYFVSLNAIKSIPLHCNLKRARQKSQQPGIAAKARAHNEALIASYHAKLAMLCHRPVDDLESLIYCTLWMIGEISPAHKHCELLAQSQVKKAILSDPGELVLNILPTFKLDEVTFDVVSELLRSLTQTLNEVNVMREKKYEASAKDAQLAITFANATYPTLQQLAEKGHWAVDEALIDWEAAAFDKFKEAFDTACFELAKLQHKSC